MEQYVVVQQILKATKKSIKFRDLMVMKKKPVDWRDQGCSGH